MRRLNWPNIIIALVIVAIAIGVFFVFRKSPEEKTDLAAKTEQQQKQEAAAKEPEATDNKPAAGNDGTSAPQASATPAPSASSAPAAPAAPATPNRQLARSGPAETTAVFIGSVIIGGLAFHAVQRRRISISA